MDRNRQHVFIIGAKGIGGYGGFETFVRKLLEYDNALESRGIRYHVCCKANGYGAYDEGHLQQAETVGERDFRYMGAECHKIRVPEIGSAQAVFYDLASMIWSIRESRRKGLAEPVFYILSCRLGIAIGILSRMIRKGNGRFYLNPDGREWKREKWNRLIRAYFRFSEKRMVRYADRVVCDSKNMEAFVREEYPCAAEKTCFIPYGAELLENGDTDRQKALRWYSEYGLEKGGYYLMVSRLIPENSYEIIISEFMNCRSERKLVMITTENSKFLATLERKLHWSRDPRIVFTNPVYDEKLLKTIRMQAYACIHGHTAGGTNPSLLEAMAENGLCLVRDVPYNMEVAGNHVLCWSGDRGSLSDLINRAELMRPDEIERYRKLAKERIRSAYAWNDIAEQYRKLFTERMDSEHTKR